jgi:hypothetical protein
MMGNVTRTTGWLLALVVAGFAWADDPPKKADKKPDPKGAPAPANPLSADEVKRQAGPEAARKKLIGGGQFLGTIVDADKEKKTLSVQVTLQVPVVNPEALANHVNLLGQLAIAARNPDPQERLDQVLDIRNQIAENALQLYNYEEKQETLNLPLRNDVLFRLVRLPKAVDKKGKPHKYTVQELSQLRSQGKLPGVASNLHALKPEQLVQITLGRLPKPIPSRRSSWSWGSNFRSKSVRKKKGTGLLVLGVLSPFFPDGVK